MIRFEVDMKKEQKTITNANEGRQNKLNVPTLRFKEYYDTWQETPFDSTFDILTNNTLSRAELNHEDGTYKNIHYGDVLIKFPAHIDVEDQEVPFVNEDSSSVKFDDALLQDGDIVIADTAEDYTVGKATEIENSSMRKVVSGLHTIPCRPKMKFAARYLGYYINSPAYHNQLIPYIQGVKVSSISKTLIKNTSISYPSYGEQSKISEFLSALDSKIETQNKIISKYESLIKGISRDYFNKTPDYYVSLNDLIIMGKAGGTPASTISEYYSGYIPFLSISDMTKQGKYIEYTERHISEIGLDNSSAWLVPQNSLILSMYASVGLVCINKVPLATSQAMFSMILKDSDNLDYIYYYLNFFRETQIHRLLETGTQSNINADTVRAITIPFYADKSTYVKSMLVIEKRLNNEKDMLFRLTDLKAYLLSNLFI